MNQSDKIFKEKLENYQRPAPAGAWSRVEAGLTKKNKKVGWLRIAASLLLLATVSAGLYSILKEEEKSDVLTHAEPKVKKTPPQTIDAVPSLVDKSDRTTTQADEASKERTIASTKVHEKGAERSSTSSMTEQTPSINSDNNVDTTPDTNLLTPETPQQVAQQEDVKNYKLVVEAEEVNQKYLTKKTIAKATSSKENSSGIQKLLDKANDLKTNQYTFGDLRQMKNEILALSFESKKKDEQNK